MKKKYLISIILIIFFILLIISNFNQIRSLARSQLTHDQKVLIKEIFFGKKYLEEINFYKKLGYNKYQIPQTQFLDLEFKKIPIKGLVGFETHYNFMFKKSDRVFKFYLENVNDGILVASASGKFQLSSNYSFSSFKKLESNLNDLNVFQILDISKIEEEIYVSFIVKDKDNNCVYLGIANATLNREYLFFDIFYKDNECTQETNGLGGRIFPYAFEEKKGFLITTAATDKMSDKAQDVKSFFGKVWFFDLASKNKILISVGHRNPQGLIVVDDNIILTEHGPYGGDEINKIKLNKNYGFPKASYGELYSFKNEKEKFKKPKYELLKSHLEYEFEEPIFSFVPSIGISQIEKIPNSFSEYWIDNFLITSLNDRTIYRVKFNKNYEKVLYMEPMFLGERIRDINYIEDEKMIILALEETGSIGILRSNQTN